MRIHDPHVNVKMKVGPGKVSMCLFPLLSTAPGQRRTPGWDGVTCRGFPCLGGGTNNTEICSKYIISISTRGETLLTGDPLIGEM